MPVATRRLQTEGREVARIAVPVSMEFVLTLVLGFVNQVVVGTLGAVAIAAVGFANALVVIAVMTLGALGNSASILVARARGAGNQHDVNTVVSVALAVASVITAVLCLPLLAWSTELLRLVGASSAVAASGSTYLALMGLTMVPTTLSAILSGTMRSTGRPKSPLVATIVTVVLEALLAFGLVFGVGPLPRLGVPGAGWAALVTATLKVAILVAQAFGVHRLVSWRWPGSTSEWRRVLAPLVVLAAPLALTALLWSGGTFLYNVVAARLGDEALAAAQIVNTLEGIFIVGSVGLMSAATALVGRSLGAGDAVGAMTWVDRVTRSGRWTGIVFGALFAVSALTLPVLFEHAGQAVRHAATLGILINGAFHVVKVRNLILGAGVLPAGSDVRGVITGDAVGAFVVGLPLAVLLGLHTPLGIAGVFLARVIEEVAKVAVFSWRAHRLDWQELATRAAQPERGSRVAA
jgi:putative MATE family efflux protein